MQYIHGLIMASGAVTFQRDFARKESEDAIGIAFPMGHSLRIRAEALRYLADVLAQNGMAWLRPVGPPTGRWLIDLDHLAVLLSPSPTWLTGTTLVDPDFALEQRYQSPPPVLRGPARSPVAVPHPEEPKPTVRFTIFRESLSMPDPVPAPKELDEPLAAFRAEHPNPRKCGFLMMRFESTTLHSAVVTSIRNTLGAHGLVALRADDKAYSDDLLPNIRTYMHGCGFGIGVFERLTAEDFNPNVSLEVGYMMALGKPTCLLKDKTLRSLHADLVGRLYRQFDTQHPDTTITPVLNAWLTEKDLT